jgi:DNA-binding transcriptional regulator LsrR (DeoR family)
MSYLTKEQVEAIPAMIERGMTQGDIAEYYGIARNNINRWVRVLRKRGVKIKTKFGKPATLSRVKEPPCQTQQN